MGENPFYGASNGSLKRDIVELNLRGEGKSSAKSYFTVITPRYNAILMVKVSYD